MPEPRTNPSMDDYRSMMCSTHAPDQLKANVLREASHLRGEGDPKPRTVAAPKRRHVVGFAAAACLTAVVGAGIAGIALGWPGFPQLFAPLNDVVGNSFALAAYAAENPDGEPGKTVELDSGRFSGGGGYSGYWYNPADQLFWDYTWAGYKFHFPMNCVGTNIETVTYEIEGERSYFETIDQRVTAEEVEQGTPVFNYSKSVVFDYEDQRAISDDRIVSLYIGFPLPEDGKRAYETLLSEGNSKELSRQLDLAIEQGAAKEISRARLKLTATFADGSTQTKSYVIEPVEDFDERYLGYRDAWDDFVNSLEAPPSDASDEEQQAYLSQAPEMPKLYTITEIAEG